MLIMRMNLKGSKDLLLVHFPGPLSEGVLGFILSSLIQQTCFLPLSAYLCLHCYHPGPLLSVAHSPVDVTLVVAAAASGVKRWLSVLLVVKTATVTLHPSAAGGSA